ncbi:hypothetical protein DEH84_03185 [Aquabacterium olei]|uniref:OmpW family protein n=1 Tax=Aquabacterium olei TaxID=1296669 RepID=A0A2U8FQE7_9BURK|nr:OmpW family outer membrane protein [Aquabacterium olei]AWI52536.1 hypothetical protein DEH84_03185 [Aquabacterium olei]
MIRRGRFALNLFSLAFAASLSGGVQAQASDPYIAKQLSSAVRGNLFMRLGYTSISVQNKSGDARDITGPVVTMADLDAAAALGDSLPASDPLSAWQLKSNIDDGVTPGNSPDGPEAIYSSYMDLFRSAVAQEGGGLGTPKGIKAKVGNSATVTLSLGYWLSDDHTWVAEAYVLAAPLTVKAYGDGVNVNGKPNGLAGKEIIETKMLPPLAVFGRYFGNRESRFRPYLGVGATYAVFFDTRTTNAYESYVGGRSTAKLKNAFGVGPFAGLKWQIDDDWHVSLAVGQVKIKTEATVTSYNTQIRSGDRVLADYVTTVGEAIKLAEGRTGADPQFTTKLMQLVARNRGGADQGTYVRKQDQSLTNTIFNISIGRSF